MLCLLMSPVRIQQIKDTTWKGNLYMTTMWNIGLSNPNVRNSVVIDDVAMGTDDRVAQLFTLI